MEYLRGGSLKDLMCRLKEAKASLKTVHASRIIRKVLEAVAYLHSFDIVHRDLKPGTCFLTEGNIMFAKPNDMDSLKLIDFGLSEQYDSADILTEKCGTAIYAAPEVFNACQYTKVSWS